LNTLEVTIFSGGNVRLITLLTSVVGILFLLVIAFALFMLFKYVKTTRILTIIVGFIITVLGFILPSPKLAQVGFLIIGILIFVLIIEKLYRK
jgi:hypothetical protein